MNAFNILISRNNRLINLNIRPVGDIGFMVLFKGALVGELFLDEQGSAWGAISARELFKYGNIDYPCDESADCRGLIFDKELISRIGREISNVRYLSNH
ncbi:hypothetical protein FA048_15990 [Pedobacter polaris]|uniref:Uncharacterized protein n=1 Tax=Pedobacter polaris TaxID=2571273 RepID=A0A4U1CMQ0_9SPHI|nr:hypothetical protein [Pedobacter polaris]TKC06702.1 hypothetical protein FA048_15990 [Pedobacter polaris]